MSTASSSPPTIVGHRVVRAKMKVKNKREGVARFQRVQDDESRVDPDLVKSSWEFSNRKFKSFDDGELVVATFRISQTGRRFLLNVRPHDLDTIKEEEEPEVERIEVIDGFYYPPAVKRVFTLADRVAKKEGMIVLLMVGPSGYGKTTFPKRFAEKTGRNHIRVNCAAIRDPEEWLGFREAKDGTTVFEPTEFARAMQQGNSVIVLDEINRLEPWLHNTLFPLLDDDRATVVHNQRFEVAADTIFVLTLNQGIEFTGTFELDQAFINRVQATVHVGPPPEHHEIEVLCQREKVSKANATKVVKVATRLREIVARGETDVDCSTRAVLRIAQLLGYGASMRSCFYDIVEAATPDAETRKKLSDVINSEIGIFSEKGGDSVFDN